MIDALTIDIEEPGFIKPISGDKEEMSRFADHFRKSVLELADFLDNHKIKGTFFIVGSVADQYPDILEELDKRGHLLGVHSYEHRDLDTITREDYREELEKAINAVETVTGKKVLSHRAPHWSIFRSTLWALDILEEMGIKYDSSIYPMETQIFGMRGIPSFPFRIRDSELIEFPPGIVKFSGVAVPFSGGTYLRVLPMSVVRLGYRRLHDEGYPALLYVHPWETKADLWVRESTPEQYDRMYEILKETLGCLEKLFKEFKFAPLEEVLAGQDKFQVIDIHKSPVG